MKRFISFAILALSVLCMAAPGLAQDTTGAAQPVIGVEEKLGDRVPLNAYFFDADDKTVFFKDLLSDKPIILVLVYYNCPYICSPLLDELARIVTETKRMQPGVDYNIVTVSFDETEGVDKAREFRNRYHENLAQMGNPIASEGWRFFTGTKENIDRLTDAVGFRYVRQGKDFGHPGVLTVISPEGKITRYVKGSSFVAAEVELALQDSIKGRVGASRVAGNAPGGKLLAFCFQIDPETQQWVPNVTRIAGTATILFCGCFIGFVLFLGRGGRKPKSPADEG